MDIKKHGRKQPLPLNFFLKKGKSCYNFYCSYNQANNNDNKEKKQHQDYTLRTQVSTFSQ